MIVLSAQDNGTYNVFRIAAPAKGTLEVFGSFNSATATLHYSSDGGTTWRAFQSEDSTGTVGDVAWTATETKTCDPFPAGAYRLVIAGGSSAAISANLSCPTGTTYT